MSQEPFRSPRYFHTFGALPPTLRVDPPSRIRVECPDSDGMFADGSLLDESQWHESAGSDIFPGNPMAGPIHVAGAEPGDVLSVRIDAIHLTAKHGQTLLKPGHGLLATHELSPSDPAAVPQHMYRWHIDAKRGFAELMNPLGDDPIEIKLDPFIGCIGVCPGWGQSISTLFAGSFGGNMDVPLLRPGATIFLPVHANGALLGLGDLHAAQGHGEIIGGAIETAGQVELSINLIKDRTIQSPRLRDASILAAICTAGDLSAAIRGAYAQLIQWLADGFGIHRLDAYNLVSQRGSMVLGNIISGTCSVAVSLPIDALPPGAIAREEDFR